MDKKSSVKIGVEWLKLEKNSSIWKNEDVRLLFIDFSFLDVQGEETETPNSLPKPKKPEDKCEYNFYKGWLTWFFVVLCACYVSKIW